MENKFMRVDEVARELGISESYAYKVIRSLNNELKAKG
ncbi:MAG: helix-turn-helix domain-containing protein, partial [Clostridia bacterium]|nr:helix-turn-helix domain-containing protein [Clostridia bacterium]